MKILVFLLVFLMPFAAVAQEKEAFCQKLTHHVPDDDVNFEPGRDDVVPADIGGGVAQPIFEPISVPIQLELLEYMDLDVPDGLDLEPYVAQVDVFQDGRVLYNGQDISKQTVVLCSDADGQEQDDGLNSQTNETKDIKEGIEREPLSETKSTDE